MSESTNDGHAIIRDTDGAIFDPHGQAAMLLVESLIHALIRQSIITVADAIELIEVAAEVREDVSIERGEAVEKTAKSVAILKSISASLAWDLRSDTEAVD